MCIYNNNNNNNNNNNTKPIKVFFKFIIHFRRKIV